MVAGLRVPQTLAEIKGLLAERGLAPKRSLGQNFLVDHNLIAKLVRAAGVTPGTLVLEVGPGTGTLTEALLDAGASVLACELDDGLAVLLRERFADREGFALVHGDALRGKRALNTEVAERLGDRPFALVANLPYGCATPLLSTLLLHRPACGAMAVTVQKEVVDRLLASPGTRDFGPLSVIAQAACEAERIAHLPPACFWPRPGVDSAMVLLRRRPEPPCDLAVLSEACGALFRQRRKRIAAPLRELLGDADPPEGVAPGMRAEEIAVDALAALARQLSAMRAASDAMREP
ncbi:MAG: 16S rRNA (adenine(1518)-N(6)/adenine(1519)-N(6))-dimethyltransferase RsmA [Planctomycetota bacterium]